MLAETVQGFRLSPQQRRIWSLCERGLVSGRGRCVIDVRGELDPLILTDALRQVVQAHEMLRTSFRLLPGMSYPLQVISEDPDFNYTMSDAWRPESNYEAVLELGDGSRHIGEGPPLGVTHAIFDRNRHVLVLDVRPLCADALSLQILARQIRQAYVSRRDGGPFRGPSVQYADVSQTLNDCVESAEFDFAKGLWRERISSASSLSEYPFEQTTAAMSSAGAVSVPLTDFVQATIAEFSASSGIGRESVLLACWGLTMCRIVGVEDVLIGFCSDGRNHDMLLETIGPLSRSLPFEFRLRPSDSFEQIARAADRLRLRFAEEQHYLDPRSAEEDGAVAPAHFASCFEYVRAANYAGECEPMFATHSLSSILEPFAFKLTALNDGCGLRCWMEYDSNRLSRGDAQGIACLFAKVADSGLGSPGTPALRQLAFAPEERQEILAAAAGPEAGVEPLCIHNLFERQVQSRRDSVALAWQEEHLSYGELNRRADLVAGYLGRNSIGPETVVGLLARRSPAMVAGLLGILKAGATCLPLDAGYPVERLAYMLRDAGAARLITETALLKLAPEFVPITCLDRDRDAIAASGHSETGNSPVGSWVAPQNMVYVTYTSGSTGRPKGVAIEHRQLVNYVAAIIDRLNLQPEWRMALVSTFSADLGHTMLYPALCIGAELHVVTEECARDRSMWRQYRSQRQIDCLKATPSHVETLAEQGLDLPLRRLVLGGESCTPALVQQVRKWAPGCEVHNHYGPTECTVGAVTHRVGDDETDFVPIGKPLANIQTYVMNARSEAVIPAVPGELYIGGAGVGRGYLNLPGQTAERFVPDDLGGKPGSRLYRTGDRAQCHQNGELEYLGRLDHQIKLRGYRIEVGEIEGVLGTHPDVRQCAASLRENGQANHYLVAYVVPSGLRALDHADLRAHLRDKVPEYMIPSVFVTVKQLPLTPNGKLDRKSLPPPVPPETGRSNEPPATAIEEIVAGIFAQVLRSKDIGRQLSFFDMGGHSLLATQVISRIREVLAVEVPLRVLFDHPTASKLAAVVEQGRSASARVEGPQIKPVPRDGPLPLSFAQQRLWFLDQLFPGSSVYNIPAAVRLTGPLNVHALGDSLSELVRRHESLRTVFTDIGGQPAQTILQPWKVRVPLVDLSLLNDTEREAHMSGLAAQEVRRPFDLARGPHLRVQLLRIDATDNIVAITLHHIVADGWSMTLLRQGLASSYGAFSQGHPPALPELGTQYADYAVWQRDWLQGELLQTMLRYWEDRLAGAPPPIVISPDRVRPRVPTGRGAQTELKLSKETTDGLRALSRREGVTLFMTLLGAFSSLLKCYTGQEDLVVGTDAANRNRRETEGLIGFFVNQLVMRVDLSGDPAFTELLARLRETALGAYAYQELPFEKLVEILRPDRNLARTPLFQVKMVLQNVPEFLDEFQPAIPRRLVGRPISAPLIATAEVDMNLIVHDAPQGLLTSLRYSTDLFDEVTARRALADFQTIVERVTAEPTVRSSELVRQIRKSEGERLISGRNRVKQVRRQRLNRLRQSG